MGIITLVVLGLTLVGMAFGALFGFIRGRERALLRLVLVVISAFLALALRGAVVDAVMNINIEGETLGEMFAQSISSGSGSLPSGLTNLIFALVEIIIGFVAYFILLFALRFITWLLVFPFLKLIIRVFENKFENKYLSSIVSKTEDVVKEVAPAVEETVVEQASETEAVETEDVSENTEDEAVVEETETTDEDENASADAEPVAEMAAADPVPVRIVNVMPEKPKKHRKTFSKHRGQGALVGLAQGLLLSYFLFAPLTCLLTQVNRIATFEMNGKALVDIPEEIGLAEYSESAIGKFYNATGGWYYKIMTTTTDANGNKVSLDATLNSVSVILEITNVATSLEKDLEIFSKEDATPEEMISTLNSLSDKLIQVGTSMKEIDEGTKEMITDLITEMSGSEIPQEDIDKIKDMMTPEFFEQAGGAMKSYADYEQVKLDGTSLEQDKANEIINNAYGAIDLVGDIELDVNEEDKAKFKEAIDSNENISAEDVEKMYKIFGIQVEQTPDE